MIKQTFILNRFCCNYINHEVKTIIIVAYKFIDEQSLLQMIVRTIEGTIRSFVATKKQSEALYFRKEIVSLVMGQNVQVMRWGYHLQDLRLKDITFDLKSMSHVLASNNLIDATENEG